jgi:hypothetical protein
MNGAYIELIHGHSFESQCWRDAEGRNGARFIVGRAVDRCFAGAMTVEGNFFQERPGIATRFQEAAS